MKSLFKFLLDDGKYLENNRHQKAYREDTIFFDDKPYKVIDFSADSTEVLLEFNTSRYWYKLLYPGIRNDWTK